MLIRWRETSVPFWCWDSCRSRYAANLAIGILDLIGQDVWTHFWFLESTKVMHKRGVDLVIQSWYEVWDFRFLRNQWSTKEWIRLQLNSTIWNGTSLCCLNWSLKLDKQRLRSICHKSNDCPWINMDLSVCPCKILFEVAWEGTEVLGAHVLEKEACASEGAHAICFC
jgi:hypothetical protein